MKKGRIYPYQHTECKFHKNFDSDNFSPQKSENGELLFLLVERKDTVGFLNLVQGSYPDLEPYKSKKIQRYLNELTCEERHKLVSCSFSDLWKVAGSDKKDVPKAEAKFLNLDIESLINNTNCLHKEADYLMPKGRLKFAESTRQCALREFSEETGYNRNDVTLLDLPPYTEQFTGTDGKMYRNIFYIARLKDNARIYTRLGEDPNQSKEVRNIGWFNLKDCLSIIRDYHQEKKDILQEAYAAIVLLLPPPPSIYRYTHDNYDNYRIYKNVQQSQYKNFSRGCFNNSLSYPSPERWDRTWRPDTYRFVGDVTSVQTSQI